MSELIIPVALCGGSGTRLWLHSRKSSPKQFVPFNGGKSLRRLTTERAVPLGQQLMVAAAVDRHILVGKALTQPPAPTLAVLGPQAGHSSAAMALAALHSPSTWDKKTRCRSSALLTTTAPNTGSPFRGTAEITCGDKIYLPTENHSTFIHIGEVQSGSYPGGDNIVHLEDTYGRAAPTPVPSP